MRRHLGRHHSSRKRREGLLRANTNVIRTAEAEPGFLLQHGREDSSPLSFLPLLARCIISSFAFGAIGVGMRREKGRREKEEGNVCCAVSEIILPPLLPAAKIRLLAGGRADGGRARNIPRTHMWKEEEGICIKQGREGGKSCTYSCLLPPNYTTTFPRFIPSNNHTHRRKGMSVGSDFFPFAQFSY